MNAPPFWSANSRNLASGFPGHTLSDVICQQVCEGSCVINDKLFWQIDILVIKCFYMILEVLINSYCE